LLHIFGNMQGVANKLTSLEKEKAQLQQIVNGLINEKLELKNRISNLEKRIAELEKLIREVLSKEE